jgi:hypothetical protein
MLFHRGLPAQNMVDGLISDCRFKNRRRFSVNNHDSTLSFSAYGIGSLAPAAAKARSRNTQLSQTPHALSWRL